MGQHIKRLFCVFSLLAVILAGTSGTCAAEVKASFKKCLKCHQDLQKEMRLTGAHVPFKKFQCGSCHDPHTSNYKFLVKKEIGTLCKGCHKNKVVKHNFTHIPVEEGNCTKCHDPHASKDRNLLIAKEKDICFTCHKSEQIFPGSKKHAPAKQGRCLKCHDPHGADNQAFLRKNKKKICIACHSMKTNKSRKAHQSYPVLGANCVSCHNPHGSRNNNLIKKNKHQPFAKNKCTTCHNPPGSKAPLVKNRKQDEIRHLDKIVNIRSARSTSSDVVGKLHPGDKVKVGFLKDNWYAVFNVDKPISDEAKAVGYVFAPLLDSVSASPAGRQWDANRYLDKNKKGVLVCLQCHKNVSKDFNKINNHVQNGIFCVNCHNPHASDQSGMKKGVLTKTCLTCHQDTQWRMNDKKTKYQHPEVKKGNCNVCHNPHGSNFRLFFLNDEFTVCTKCHKRHAKFSHPLGVDAIDPRSKRDITCITCHDLMGSQYEYELRFDRKKQLCIQCHTSY